MSKWVDDTVEKIRQWEIEKVKMLDNDIMR